MIDLKRKLEKLTNKQLKHVCNKMGVKYNKSKKSTINILLKPFVKKYKVVENLTTNAPRTSRHLRSRSRSRRNHNGNRGGNSVTDTTDNYWQHLIENPDSDGRQHYTQEEIEDAENRYYKPIRSSEM